MNPASPTCLQCLLAKVPAELTADELRELEINFKRMQVLLARVPAELTADELCELGETLAWCEQNHTGV